MSNSDNIIVKRKRDICIFIWNNYMKKITLTDLSKALSLSERTCQRLIHDHLQTKLNLLLNAVRFYKTIEYYQRHGGNIVHCAIENGFQDRQVFRQWWKRWVNTPINHQNIDYEKIKTELSDEYNELIEKILSLIPDNIK